MLILIWLPPQLAPCGLTQTLTQRLAPFVLRALNQIRYHDDPVSFEAYGDYATSSSGTSPVRELLATLAWLGPHARGVLPELEAIAQSGGLSKKALIEADRTLETIRGSDQAERADSDSCCTLPAGLLSKVSWSSNSRHGTEPIDSTVFEDQEGDRITFKEFFHGHPSIVVFFYTRCDNPLKCSLTITKLARIQKLLAEQGLADQINTAAITYDPAFDLPVRIRSYGQNRGVRLDVGHRMLRATDGINALRGHFKLGVNFIESLVNRHRVEAYILDAKGRIASSFERLHWDEQEVVDRAVEVLTEKNDVPLTDVPPKRPALTWTASPVLGTLASLGSGVLPEVSDLLVRISELVRHRGIESNPVFSVARANPHHRDDDQYCQRVAQGPRDPPKVGPLPRKRRRSGNHRRKDGIRLGKGCHSRRPFDLGRLAFERDKLAQQPQKFYRSFQSTMARILFDHVAAIIFSAVMARESRKTAQRFLNFSQ